MTRAEFECALGAALTAGEIRHFTAREICNLDRVAGGVHLAQAPCELWPNAVRTLRVLEQLRAELGGNPIIVTSGYRDRAYNRAVGSTDGSLHVRFSAFDVRVSGVPPIELARRLAAHPEAGAFGIGCYSGFVHLDTRGALGMPAARWGEGEHASWW